MADPTLIKVCLTNKGEDTETPWATDLGPVGTDGSRKVKLVNVPFMHAKPTWGDTIIVKRTGEGPPTWDREGVPWKQIATKIVEDGGRWAMIVDYRPTTSADEAFKALARACDDAKIVCEGAWGPRDHEPGRVYLAVQKELSADQVMGILVGASLPMELIQIHPEPKKRVRAQTVVGISDDAGRPPARAKTEPPKKSETSQATRSAAVKQTETSQAATQTATKKSEASAAAKPANNAVPAANEKAGKKPAPTKAPAKAAAKPVATPAAKPAAKPAATEKSPAKTATKPAAKSGAKPAAKSAAKPAAKSAAKPAAKSAAKPAAKSAAKPAAKSPAKTASKKR